MSKDCRETICRVIERVLRDSGRPMPDAPSDEATLQETFKLDSLDLAVMVVALESELGIDPFRDGVRPVRTLGELVEVYETATK
ncbi:MAG: acyl carrier protein [Planctomycetota bacterium]